MNENKENENIETLGGLEENPYLGKTTDIKQTVFQRLSTMNNDYSNLNNHDNSINQNNNTKVKTKIKKEKVKKDSRPKPRREKNTISIPVGFVVFLVIIINVIWYCGVYFVLIPNYNEYKKNSIEIAEKVEYLDGLLKAIVGE